MTITEILEHYNIPRAPEGHHHRTPDFEQVDCAYCTPNTQRWRMGLARDGSLARCWSCGVKSIISVLQELTGERYNVLKDLLKDLEGSGRLPKYDKGLEPKGKLVIPSGLGPLLPIHKNYLRERGFNPEELVKLWNIQGFGLHHRFSWRIYIPITYKGDQVSYTTRAPTEDVINRYINAKKEEEKISMKKVIYGNEYLKHAIVVVEGPADVWSIGPGAGGTLGVGYSRAQLLQISKFPVRVIAFDSEKDAQNRARELCETLAPFPGVTKNLVLDAKDPGSADRKEIRKLRKEFLD